MAWFQVDDGLAMHPKVSGAGNAAMGLWVRCGAWSVRYQTSGFIATDTVRSLGTREQVRQLIAAGLWDAVDGGYQLHQRDHIQLWRVARDQTVDPHRPAISARIRTAVFDRDGYVCQICSVGDDLTLDHIYPWSLGGTDTAENLRVLCRSCNSSRGNRIEVNH